jgi:polyhydroxybutyrate depolymerase
MDYGGVKRTYQLSLPKSYDGRTADPVILNLHGLTSNIQEQDIVSNFPAFGGARGYVIVTPQARAQRLGGANSLLTTQWNLSTTATGGASDVGFLLALLDRVHRDVCTDTHREYVAGVSDGAAMVMSLRCAAGNQFAALAADAGVTLGSCTKKISTPLIAFHGTADPLVPYQGHDGANSVEGAMAGLAASGGCKTTPTVTMPFPDARHLIYPCTGGMGLELWTIIGGGHTWPGVTAYVDPNSARKKPDGSPAGSPYGTAALVKHQTTDVIATKLMLDFFDSHRGR